MRLSKKKKTSITRCVGREYSCQTSICRGGLPLFCSFSVTLIRYTLELCSKYFMLRSFAHTNFRIFYKHISLLRTASVVSCLVPCLHSVKKLMATTSKIHNTNETNSKGTLTVRHRRLHFWCAQCRDTSTNVHRAVTLRSRGTHFVNEPTLVRKACDCSGPQRYITTQRDITRWWRLHLCTRRYHWTLGDRYSAQDSILSHATGNGAQHERSLPAVARCIAVRILHVSPYIAHRLSFGCC